MQMCSQMNTFVYVYTQTCVGYVETNTPMYTHTHTHPSHTYTHTYAPNMHTHTPPTHAHTMLDLTQFAYNMTSLYMCANSMHTCIRMPVCTDKVHYGRCIPSESQQTSTHLDAALRDVPDLFIIKAVESISVWVLTVGNVYRMNTQYTHCELAE